MSETLIASLQQRLNELTSENASLKAENVDRRTKGKKAGTELEQLRKQVETLTGERDTYKGKAEAQPGELQATIDSLQGQIRTRDHRDAFAAVGEFEVAGADGKAKKYKLADGVKLDALWQLTQYKAEGETPDAKAVSGRYAEALEAHPFLFAEAAPGGAQRPITVQAREGGPGAGKSGTSSTITGAPGWQAEQSANYIPGRI